jgi:hypothetical protein
MARINPIQRMELHDAAVSAEKNGSLYNFQWKLIPKMTAPIEIDEDKQVAITSMGTMMYENSGFAKLSLHVYQALYYKIKSFYTPSEVQITIKGSSALAFHFSNVEEYNEIFPFSDIDIAIMINPAFADEEFCAIMEHIKELTGQVFAKHKQYMDRLFFKSSLSDTIMPPSFEVYEFIDRHVQMCESIDLVSPFVSNEIRNACSYSSFTIKNHASDPTKVVKVNEPHFNKAEFIPFNRTPIFCSMNESLDDFVLYRMKWNLMDMDNRYTSVDFIDCIIPKKSHVELVNFAAEGGFDQNCTVVVQRYGMYVSVMSLHHLLNDLYRCLYVYECPESKKEVRMKRYNILKDYLGGV